mmetsp:Transcript_4393/g.13411  ORF Transcript_4393/g.13411 Transcript_4393/m.13411 type:complete len:95 (+) Transcript_4393:1478-1762(+)
MLMGSSFAHASSTITPTPTFLSAYIVYMSAPYAPPWSSPLPSSASPLSAVPPPIHLPTTFFFVRLSFFFIYILPSVSVPHRSSSLLERRKQHRW